MEMKPKSTLQPPRLVASKQKKKGKRKEKERGKERKKERREKKREKRKMGNGKWEMGNGKSKPKVQFLCTTVVQVRSKNPQKPKKK